MIKKNELRIGNIVNCHFLTTNFNAEVLEVRHGGVMVQDGDYQNVYGYDNISPLQISPEILEKAGFELLPWGYVKKAREDFGIRLNIKTFSYDVSGNSPVKLKYVHQLQNLYFALSGEELTIQL